jgi:hypothetical protein
MRKVLAPGLVPASEIEGQPRPSRDKIVPRKFGKVAKVIWTKPAAVIADIANCDIRTGKRILRGEAPIPACVLLAACEEMLKPIE